MAFLRTYHLRIFYIVANIVYLALLVTGISINSGITGPAIGFIALWVSCNVICLTLRHAYYKHASRQLARRHR